jgi:hypothetical protein
VAELISVDFKTVSTRDYMNPLNHRSSEIPIIWDEILASDKTPLRQIQAGRGEWAPFYTQLHGQKGVYVLRTADDGSVVYIGIAGDGAKKGMDPIEGALADRLWTHKDFTSIVGKRLAVLNINVLDCQVQTHIENDQLRRIRIESYGIAVFDPVANK